MKSWEDSQSSSCLKSYPIQFLDTHIWPYTQHSHHHLYYQRYWKSLSPVRLFTSFQAILQPAGLKFFKSNSKASLVLLGTDYEIPFASKQSKIFYNKQLFPYERCVEIQFYIYLGAFQIWFYFIWNHIQEFQLNVSCWEPLS